jgi:hypothetical protein
MKNRCVSTLPGYFPISPKVASPFTTGIQSLPAADKSQGPVPRLFEKLAKIQTLITSVDFQCSILHHAELLPLRTVLHRLGMMLQSRKCQKTPLQKLTRSTSTVSIMLFIFDIIFGSLEHPELNPASRHDELLRIQQRLISQKLDHEGSFEKAWQVLMVGDEQPSLQLHSRAWPIAETTNILKHLNLTTLDSLSKMLMGFLLPGICGEIGEYGLEKLLQQIHLELDGLSSLS